MKEQPGSDPKIHGNSNRDAQRCQGLNTCSGGVNAIEELADNQKTNKVTNQKKKVEEGGKKLKRLKKEKCQQWFGDLGG